MFRAAAALALSGLALTACASAPARRAPRAADGAIAAWVAREPRRAPPIHFADPAALELPGEAPIVRSRPEGAVGASAAPVDVSLHGAPLGSALRLLAEAADMGIVLGEGLTAPVDVELRRVRPMDAMLALARAHHVELTVRGRTVIARLP